jgi:hypothetical protein
MTTDPHPELAPARQRLGRLLARRRRSLRETHAQLGERVGDVGGNAIKQFVKRGGRRLPFGLAVRLALELGLELAPLLTAEQRETVARLRLYERRRRRRQGARP